MAVCFIFFHNANYTSLIMELEKLLENDKITVLSPKNVFQALYQRNKQQK